MRDAHLPSLLKLRADFNVAAVYSRTHEAGRGAGRAPAQAGRPVHGPGCAVGPPRTSPRSTSRRPSKCSRTYCAALAAG
ncbi:MAG: hypothetical protein R2854_05515 [Caldilineaceae bacterium]